MEINVPQGKRRLAVKLKSSSDFIEIIPIGDAHSENEGFDKNAFRRCIRYIAAEPYRYGMLMGDQFDCIARDDRRSFPDIARSEYRDMMDDLWQSAQYNFAQELMCIKDKLLGIHDGNHEHALHKRYQIDMTQGLCDKLNEHRIPKSIAPERRLDYLRKLSDASIPLEGVKNLRYCAYTVINFSRAKSESRKDFVIWSHHGAGGGRKVGSSLNRLVEVSEGFDADFYVVGHHHRKASTSTEYLYVKRSGADKPPQLAVKERHFAIVPSFMRGFQVGRKDSYAERFMLSPSYIGFTKVKVRPFAGRNKERMEVEIS